MSGELVGRARELESLLGWIGESLAGSPRFVLVVGDAGIGKTTMAAAAAAERGVRVAWGRTTDAGDAPPFRPWRQLLAAVGGVSTCSIPSPRRTRWWVGPSASGPTRTSSPGTLTGAAGCW